MQILRLGDVFVESYHLSIEFRTCDVAVLSVSFVSFGAFPAIVCNECLEQRRDDYEFTGNTQATEN